MATEQQMIAALRKAHDAGDTNGAQRIATMIKTMRSKPAKPKDNSAARGFGLGAIKPFDNAAEALGNVPYLGAALDGIGEAIGLPTSKQASTQNSQARANNTRKLFQIGGNIAGLGAVTVATKGAGGVVGQGAAGGALLSDKRDTGGIALDAGLGAGAGYLGGQIASKLIGPAVGYLSLKAAPYIPQSLRNLTGGILSSTPKAPANTPANASVKLIRKALAADGLTPRQVSAAMKQASRRGVPIVPADVGENLRELGAALGRSPGASRTIARDVTRVRQNAQSERIIDAVNRNLGPTTDTIAAGEALIAKARSDASPIYEAALRASGASSVDISGISKTPLGQKALAKASDRVRNTLDEAGQPVDPKTAGFDFDAQGNLIPAKTQSFQTLHHLKMGLDDIIEGGYDPITRGYSPEARAATAMKNHLVKQIDAVNPAYASARAAYAEPASARAAMQLGEKMLTRSPNEIAAETRKLKPTELPHFALGFRSKIATLLESKTDGANKVATLLASPAKRKALANVFGGEAHFKQFLNTLADEQAAQRTAAAVHGGSQTAGRLLDDAAVNDNSIGELAVDAALVLRDGKAGLLRLAINKADDIRKFGVGKAAQRTRDETAALLFSSNADELVNSFGYSAQKAARAESIAKMLSHLGGQTKVAPAAAQQIGANNEQ